jgi:SAM-dependent methyltransferase
VHGRADRLPYGHDSFDRIMICLVLHHLTTDGRRRTLTEALRVVRPGGEVHIADFGPPHSAGMRLVAAIMRRLEQTADLFDGKLPCSPKAVGFVSVAETARVDTPLGHLVLLKAIKSRQVGGHHIERAQPGDSQGGQTQMGIAIPPSTA